MQRMQLAEEEQDEIDAADAIAKAKGGRRTIGIHQAKAALRGTRTKTRLGGGFYMFGTKKIYAKIMNGRLVIRVGGGYMSIDEFMKYHGVQEMQ